MEKKSKLLSVLGNKSLGKSEDFDVHFIASDQVFLRFAISLGNQSQMLVSGSQQELKSKRFIMVAGALILALIWCAATWIVEKRASHLRAESIIRQEIKRSEFQAQSVVTDLQRSLRLLQTAPSIIAYDAEIVKVLSEIAQAQRLHFSSDAERIASIREKNKQPLLMRVNQILLNAKNNHSFELAWLMDANGDTIASSNFDKAETLVGGNFRDRAYFISPLNGKPGYQYAVGKISKTPGLYFSAPVYSKDQIVGVVGIKVEIAHLAQDIDLDGVFLLDENGVVILAQDKLQEMKAIEEGAVYTLTLEKRRAIYKLDDFPALEFKPWPDSRYAQLFSFGRSSIPQIMTRVKLAEKPLEVLYLAPIPQILEVDGEFYWRFGVVSLAGCGVIFVLAGLLLYLRESNATRKLLQAQRDELAEAQRLGHMGSWRYDLRTHNMECSEQARRFFLIDDTQLEPTLTRMYEAAHKDDRPALEQTITRAIATADAFHFEYRILRIGGEVRYVVVDGMANKNERKQIAYVSGSIRDITEQQLLLSALASSETHLKHVINSCLIGIVQGNEQGELIEVNDAFSNLTAYPVNYFTENKIYWRDMMPASFHHVDRDAFDALNKNGASTPYEKELICFDGKIIPVLIGVARIAESERGWVGFVLDLSERNRISRLQAEFIALISHELRTPLTSIRGSLSLLEAGVMGILPEKAMQLITVANRNSNRLTVLVNDILDMEKLNAGKMKFDLKPVDLSELLKQAVEMNKAYADTFNVRYQVDTAVVSAEVLIDQDRALQVLTNLMSNAAKFSPAGGVVKLTLSWQDEAWRIQVIDHGPGIPASFHAAIFSSFSQADNSDTRQKQGTGLGLKISKSMVELMNGKIGFETEEGKGTCFWISFPEA